MVAVAITVGVRGSLERRVVGFVQHLLEEFAIATSEIKGASKTQPNSWLEDLLAAGLVTRTRVRTHWVWSAQPEAFQAHRE
ncbi:hypothetical protein [Yimella sp. NH-Cas1]|uniref:hypothetical protein n=1 Tax=Yimella sp. NH-Cas1 TaxID=2917726 RepID=UPI001EFBBCD7|nr:hypothetical protein [Yimella sp. NH-Cas1]MCG8654248.1 hypothetical protein [Yimella sp. NH-Cas1]